VVVDVVRAASVGDDAGDQGGDAEVAEGCWLLSLSLLIEAGMEGVMMRECGV
jgi:hypothetical protein